MTCVTYQCVHETTTRVYVIRLYFLDKAVGYLYNGDRYKKYSVVVQI